MNCPKCGAENADDATICTACNCSLAEPATGSRDVAVRVSALALTAFALAVITLVAVLFVPHLLQRRVPPIPLVRPLAFLIAWVGPIATIILGLTSLIRIELGGGRISGRSYAVVAIALPVVTLLLSFCIMVLARTRCLAFRMTCGTNLSGIGKAMLIYANDYDDELPRAGGRGGRWAARTPKWMGADRFDAFGVSPLDGSGGRATVSGSLYLLVKYAEATPKLFLCEGDKRATEFKLSNEKGVPVDFELIDAWDFGSEPTEHCSWAYHMPYSKYRLTTAAKPGMAILSARNPWMDSPFNKARNFSKFSPHLRPFNGTRDQTRQGNCLGHDGDGQNVLYLDSHVTFEKYAYCGVDDDNIYTRWDGDDRIWGLPPVFGSEPADEHDSLLVNDPP